MTTSTGNSESRIPALDGVRGLAILLVLVWHYFVIDTRPEPGTLLAFIKSSLSLTFAGVDLFFVLSGFLIGGILLRNRTAENYFSVFYTRRFARLMPIYLIVLASYFIAAPWLRAGNTEAGKWLADGTNGALPLWSYLLYLQNMSMAYANTSGGHWISVTWSLAVEEQFYLLAPLLIWLLPPRHLKPVLIALIVSALLLRVIVTIASGHGQLAYVLLPCRWDELCMGMLVAAHVHAGGAAWFRANQDRIKRTLGIGLLALAVMILEGQNGPFLPKLWIGLTIIGVVSTSILLCALYVEHPLSRAVFCNPVLAYLGRVSYGVYLLHQPVRGVIAHLLERPPFPDSWLDFGISFAALAITLGLAELSWRYMEKPILDLGHRLSYRGSTSVAPAAIGSPA